MIGENGTCKVVEEPFRTCEAERTQNIVEMSEQRFSEGIEKCEEVRKQSVIHRRPLRGNKGACGWQMLS